MTANQSKPTTKAPKADWERIERDYRAGLLSIREIAKEQGVSDTAIRKKATAYAWERNLSDQVAAMAKAELVRTNVRTANPQTEQEIVEAAASQVVNVVRGHRSRIGRQVELVDLLTQQLVDVAGRRDEFEDAIEDMTVEDKTGERRARLMKAVSLSTHASTAVNMANALKTLIGLERQAFSIKDDSTPTVNPLGDLLQQVMGTGLPVMKDDE